MSDQPGRPKCAFGGEDAGEDCPAVTLIARVERLEGKVDNMEIGMGSLRASFASMREDVSAFVGQSLTRTEKKIIKTMQDEVVSKLQTLLEFKGAQKEKE